MICPRTQFALNRHCEDTLLNVSVISRRTEPHRTWQSSTWKSPLQMSKGLLSRWATYRWPIVSLRLRAQIRQVIQNRSDSYRIFDGSHDLDGFGTAKSKAPIRERTVLGLSPLA